MELEDGAFRRRERNGQTEEESRQETIRSLERGLLRDAYFEAVFSEDKSETVRTAWQELWSKVYSERSEEQLAVLGDALVFAAWAHNGQKRHSGEPYIAHTLNVAAILAGMRMDVSTLAAAILHDVIEDTDVKKKEIAARFGSDVAELVDGVTKLNKLPYMSVEEYKAENLRKMFLVMGKDIRVVLIKLADRLHNMRTLGVLRPDKQIRIAEETLEIYAPLAHRLGIYHIKWELEDLAFKYSDPEAYEDIRRRVRKRMPDRETIVDKGIEILTQHLSDEGISFHIKGRAKHLFSIYEKMERKKLSVEQIYDILAIRVLVEDVPACYNVLGIVHATWVPIPGQFDDYIANPKSNMYQSLHTTVVGPAGEPLEIQIRTDEMNRLAEYGIAAHWRYKSGASLDNMTEGQLDWVKQMLREMQEGGDSSEFVDRLKTDFLTSEIYVFTPKGRLMLMPRGSTIIDFAYAVHTEVGHHCVGATIDGRIVPLMTEIKNGNRIEIYQSQQSAPSQDWLRIVHNSKTRQKIKAWFRQTEKLDKQEKTQHGHELLDRELKRRDMPLSGSEELQPFMNKAARDMGVSAGADIIAGVGDSSINAGAVIQRLAQLWREHEASAGVPAPPRLVGKKNDFDVIVAGETGVQVTLSNCCDPVPGDQILGYLTHLRGITVHRADCNSVREVPADRITQVTWNAPAGKIYMARLVVDALDRGNLLRDIMDAIGQGGSGVNNIKGGLIGNNIYRTKLEVSVRNLSHLLEIMGKLNGIKNILEVVRG